MSGAITGRRRPTKPKKQERAQKRKRTDVDAEKLDHAVLELPDKITVTNFEDLPLSAPTQAGLQSAHFTAFTPIQSRTIPLALKGRDILGAAKTGSGKTLAFLIPVLENLYRAQCVGADAGLGAMIISPTRELAIQIFDVLVKIGRKGHLFAAGLVIGGKSVQEERDALARMNIVVCTPGRMLQHLSQTAMFSCDNLKMLVLDEADRIMDMGFQKDVDAIVDYLPSDRQTLLFSATQTKKVSDLARLSLKDPEYVSMSDTSENATPSTLQQNYVVTPLSDKLDTLWSFIQSTKKAKIIVFFASAKEVRFVYESFRHMQPGIPLLHLHGRQKQGARLEITAKFAAAKYSCLFATDVAARGLDFPAVDWVVQVDCPEDADTYIHRVGRTARYERNGKAVLFLEPSEEEGMLSRLEGKKIPIERINVRQKKQSSIKSQLQSMCFQDPTLKYLGQKAFASYVRSVYLQKDKEVFHLDRLPLEGYASSLGLPGAPRIKFMKGDDAKARKNAPRMSAADVGSDTDGSDEDDAAAARKKTNGVRTKYDRMFERKNQDILADHYAKMTGRDGPGADALDGDGPETEDDDLFAVKQRIPVEQDLSDASSDAKGDGFNAKQVDVPGAKQPIILDSKRREKLLKSKKNLMKLKEKGTRLVFDEDGNAQPIYQVQGEDEFKAAGDAQDQRSRFLETERPKVMQADLADKEAAREKRRLKKESRKEKAREDLDDDGVDQAGADEDDALANFIADAGDADEASDYSEADPQPEEKWFQKPGKVQKQADAAGHGPETLEDLEDLVSGYIQ